jgi:antitoxin HicB
MTKIEKLTERLKNNPANVLSNDIRKLLTHEDFRLERVMGSHHIFKRGSIRFVIPVPNQRVKK